MLYISGSFYYYIEKVTEECWEVWSMKIKIEIDEALEEDVVLIQCSRLTEEISAVQRAVSEAAGTMQKFVWQNVRYHYDIWSNPDENGISAHTRTDAYQIKYRLYELEELLPRFFMRVSKSTILNTNHIYSINRNLTASSVVAFLNTHKQVYVSRYYYKPLISKLEEKRLQL